MKDFFKKYNYEFYIWKYKEREDENKGGAEESNEHILMSWDIIPKSKLEGRKFFRNKLWCEYYFLHFADCGR